MSIDADDVYNLADNYLRDLAPLHGDPEAIDAICHRWLSDLGSQRFGLVCAAAVRTVFAECLADVPRSQVPDGAIEFKESA